MALGMVSVYASLKAKQ